MQTNYSNKNFKMVVGDTESFGFEITGVSGIDAAFFSCKRESQDTSYLFQKSLGDGIEQRENNRFVVRIAPEDTQLLNPGQYYYDLEVGANGDVFTILRGILTLVPEITTTGAIVYTTVDWGNIEGTLSDQTDLQNALNAKANTSSLATVATTGSYNDLTNKPSIPTKTSDLTNDSDFVVGSDLADVATSGDFDDLINRPVNIIDLGGILPVSRLNGTLPLTQGGTGGTTAVEARTNLELMKRYVLYEQFNTSSNFTLNDNVSNYKLIEIAYYDSVNEDRMEVKFFNVVANRTSYEISLPVFMYTGSNFFAVRFSTLGFTNGTSVTFKNHSGFLVKNGSLEISSDQMSKVRYVAGYKY